MPYCRVPKALKEAGTLLFIAVSFLMSSRPGFFMIALFFSLYRAQGCPLLGRPHFSMQPQKIGKIEPVPFIDIYS